MENLFADIIDITLKNKGFVKIENYWYIFINGYRLTIYDNSIITLTNKKNGVILLEATKMTHIYTIIDWMNELE